MSELLVENKVQFQRLGTMLDCSRNGVMTVQSIKKWVDIISDLGYNTLLLYMEDTYEVDENPYFGYMRGRYSQEELREIDAYASKKGMELIPCIQTLAHLNAIVRWPEYWHHVDKDDILLAGDDRVYALIDKMFASLDKCISGRIINIGMDEAHMIGRGKYYDLHGPSDRFQVLIDHLKRVSEIGAKYGFRFLMWSDMFFRLATGGKYDPEVEIRDEIKKQIPDNVQLVYWNYWSKDKNRYDQLLQAHKKIQEDIWFAGGVRMWSGFATHNTSSMRTIKAAMESCLEQGIQNFTVTLWGDNGAECSKYATLPVLFYASELAKGNKSIKSIKEKFKEKYGISFERFMLLELPHTPNKCADNLANADKYLFYNDCFMGLADSTISGIESEQYAACARKLALLKKHPQWGYLFATQQALCEVLAIKAEIGVKTHEIYTSGDKEALKNLILEYRQLRKKIKVFHKVYKEQWFLENKPHGFDVQDLRIGGVLARVQSCEERLQDLYDGKINRIEELEEMQLDIFGNGEMFTQNHGVVLNYWNRMVTANII